MLPRTLLFLACLIPTCALAATGESPTEAAMRTAAESFLRAATASQRGEVRIEIGRLPSDARYAACRQWEGFLPAGARPWGRLSLGLRCSEGLRASFYVASRVRVFGYYLSTTRAITSGQTLQAEDVEQTAGELTQQGPDLLLEPAQAIGFVARGSIPAGKPLQALHLRQPVLIEAGQQIKLILSGSGYSVSNSGKALASASAGQRLRVRLDSGRVIEAFASAPGVAEIRH